MAPAEDDQRSRASRVSSLIVTSNDFEPSPCAGERPTRALLGERPCGPAVIHGHAHVERPPKIVADSVAELVGMSIFEISNVMEGGAYGPNAEAKGRRSGDCPRACSADEDLGRFDPQVRQLRGDDGRVPLHSLRS